MLTSIISAFRVLRRLWQISPRNGPPSPELTKELEKLRKFSLNSLMMFLGVHLAAGSKVLGSFTLALLIYTISLHLVINASFLEHCPSLSRFLHVIPFLGLSCMAVVELVINVQSPTLAAGGLLVGALPLLIMAIYHARSCTQTTLMHLPIWLREIPLHKQRYTDMTSATISSQGE